MSTVQTQVPILPITTAVTTATESDHNTACDKCLSTCIPCTVGVLSIGLLAAYCSNLVYSIMALVETSNKELQSRCSETNLWIYLLIILLLGTYNQGRSINNLKTKDSNKCMIVNTMLAQIGLLCWGSYELWGVDCVNEVSSNLIYTMVLINVVASWVLMGIMIIYIGIVTVIFCSK